MTTTEAKIEVVCPGVLEVLSIGKGDLKLTLGNDPDDVEKAQAVIEEMLRKGYAIFVETDDGPSRVQRFNPKRMTYIIAELAPGNTLPSGPAPPAALTTGTAVKADEVIAPKRRGRPPGKRTREREVPVAGSRATAVGRTAGG